MKGMKNKVKMNRQMRRHFQKNSDKETNKQKMRFQNRETTLISGDMRKNFDKNFISLVLRNMSYYIYSMDIDVLLSSSLKNLYNFWRNGNRVINASEMSRAITGVSVSYFTDKTKKFFTANSEEIFKYSSYLYLVTIKYLYSIFDFGTYLQEKSDTEVNRFFSELFNTSFFLVIENFLLYTYKIVEYKEDGLYQLTPLDDISKEQEYKKMKFIPMSDIEKIYMSMTNSENMDKCVDFQSLYNDVFAGIYQNQEFSLEVFNEKKTSDYNWSDFFVGCSKEAFNTFNAQNWTLDWMGIVKKELSGLETNEDYISCLISVPYMDYSYLRQSLYIYFGNCLSMDCSRQLLKQKEDGATLLNQEVKDLKTMNRNLLKSVKKLEKEKEEYQAAQKKEYERLALERESQETVNKSELDALQLEVERLKGIIEESKNESQKTVNKCQWQENRIKELEHMVSYYDTIESDMLGLQNENSVLMGQIDSLESLEEESDDEVFEKELKAIQDEPIFFLGGVNNMMERFVKLFPNSEYVNISDDNCNFNVPPKYKYAVMYTRVLTHAHSRRLESLVGKENIIPLNILNTRLAVHVIYEHIVGHRDKKN